MCVIAASPAGCKQPTISDLRMMWNHNPDGAGFMFARSGQVHYRKGFMTFEDFRLAVRSERFTKADSVVYHFRISTQAGINPAMCHPFPLSPVLTDHLNLSGITDIGIAHNGIIALTSNPKEKTYSDTALFISRYLSKIIRHPADLESEDIRDMIYQLARSKFAIMRGDGQIFTIGSFYTQPGNYLVSNEYYLPARNFFQRSYYFNNLHSEV